MLYHRIFLHHNTPTPYPSRGRGKDTFVVAASSLFIAENAQNVMKVQEFIEK